MIGGYIYIYIYIWSKSKGYIGCWNMRFNLWEGKCAERVPGASCFVCGADLSGADSGADWSGAEDVCNVRESNGVGKNNWKTT